MAWGKTVDEYYLDDNGDWVKGGGWQQEDKDGTWYYVWSNGTAATGWQQIGNKWYYFDDDGKMQTGWIEDKGNWYNLNSNGAMAEDTTVNGLYVDDSCKLSIGTGWKYIDGVWYYFNSNGAMQTGWQTIDGNTYYLGSDGKMVADQCVWGMLDGWRYLNSSGQLVTDKWLKVNGITYYSNASGEITADNKTPNPPVSFDITGTSISTVATVAQTVKVIPISVLNTPIRTSLAELGIFEGAFICIAPALTAVSFITDEKTYKNREELNYLHTVDIGACALTIAASVVITATGPAILVGLVIGAAAYLVKGYVVSKYN